MFICIFLTRYNNWYSISIHLTILTGYAEVKQFQTFRSLQRVCVSRPEIFNPLQCDSSSNLLHMQCIKAYSCRDKVEG